MEKDSILFLILSCFTGCLILLYIAVKGIGACFRNKEPDTNDEFTGKSLHIYVSDSSSSDLTSIRFNDMVVKPVPPPTYYGADYCSKTNDNRDLMIFPTRHSI